MKVRTVALLVVLWTAAVLVAAPASAFEESEAPAVRIEQFGRDDVVRVWHEPQPPQPGTQWRGWIEFAHNHGVNSVSFQICRVGIACFAPPQPMQREGLNVWTFDTAQYIVPGAGVPVTWEAGWRIGVRFVINETLADESYLESYFPKPSDAGVLEDDYFAFNMPAAEARDTDGPTSAPLLAVGLLLLVVFALRRR